jgi:hypothetical protein
LATEVPFRPLVDSASSNPSSLLSPTFSGARWHKPNVPFSFEQEIANENKQWQALAREILQTTSFG